MRPRSLAALTLATAAALLLVGTLAPTATARPPPAACADVGELYVSYGDIRCGDNQVCATTAEGRPGPCVDLTMTLA